MTRAKITLPTAWATSNHALATHAAMNAAHETSGPNVARNHRFMAQPNASPQAPATTARPRRVRVAGRSRAPDAPTAPHSSICAGVQGPWPRKALEMSAASAPTAMPARAPSAAPATRHIVVTGFTEGTAANSTRPAAVAAPSVAVSASILGPPAPRSHVTHPSSSSAMVARTTTAAALTRAGGTWVEGPWARRPRSPSPAPRRLRPRQRGRRGWPPARRRPLPPGAG